MDMHVAPRMPARWIVFAALLGSWKLMAGAPRFLLGVASSSEIYPIPDTYPSAQTVDVQGSVYIEANNAIEKRNSDQNLVWTAFLGSSVQFGPIAVDSSGNVYAASLAMVSGAVVIMKVNADGSLSPSSATFGTGLSASEIFVDANGRVWVIGNTTPGIANPLTTTSGAYQTTLPDTTSSHAFIARLNGAGTGIDYATYLAGSAQDYPTGIGLDGSGAAIVAGWTSSSDFPLTAPANIGSGGAVFLTRLTPDGSGLIYSIVVAPGSGAATVAVDSSGEASVDYSAQGIYTLSHFSPQGALTFSKSGEGPVVAMDAAGNTYVSGSSTGNHTVQNSLELCGSVYLDVFSPTGDMLQGTWVPNSSAAQEQPLVIAAGLNSAIYVLTSAYYEDAQVFWLTALSPNIAAQPLALACLTDAAMFTAPGSLVGSGPKAGIAPGEVVSLFGDNLGPEEGVQPQVTLQTGYPEQLSGVQVLFNGQPAPLLYVQNQR